MNNYTRSIDELIPGLTSQKIQLQTHLKRNYKENVHYIETPQKREIEAGKKLWGGHNRIDIRLTEEAFELLKNSYNLRNRNIVDITPGVKVVNIVLPIENQTLRFIENCYNGSVEMVRQYHIGKYRVDMYLPKYKIIIECDEFDHKDRDKQREIEREQYLLSLGNTVIRFDPNEKGFNISEVIREINKLIVK